MNFRQSGNVKVWALIATLAVVAGAVIFVSNIYPPEAEQSSGTIVPAQRYGASQISSEDVVLGGQSRTVSNAVGSSFDQVAWCGAMPLTVT